MAYTIMIRKISSSHANWAAQYITTPFSFNVGFLKYNLLILVKHGTCSLLKILFVNNKNVLEYEMRNKVRDGPSKWTSSSYSFIFSMCKNGNYILIWKITFTFNNIKCFNFFHFALDFDDCYKDKHTNNQRKI